MVFVLIHWLVLQKCLVELGRDTTACAILFEFCEADSDVAKSVQFIDAKS